VQAATAAEQLTAAGAKVETHVVPVGPDIARGWGLARSVAADFLFDRPVMLGSQRIGPDLANVGVRLPDANWHFRHLYDPTSVVAKSVMPPYRFLFEARTSTLPIHRPATNVPATAMAAISGSRTNFANGATLLAAPGDVETGVELVPTEDARALVAYLLSLRVSTPLLERPLTAAAPAAPATTTNATAGASTNATVL
jgi:cytochrome c oxidase cbb3-type subunit 2